MIRKILIFVVLVGAAAASIVMPLWKSDAAQPQTSGSAQAPPRRGLPNFDIRLSGRREFDDMDLSPTSGKQARRMSKLGRPRQDPHKRLRVADCQTLTFAFLAGVSLMTWT